METNDRLARYRDKRAAGKTKEPFGGGAGHGKLFVVQQHAASRLHYDLRLEWGGVLHSWAVPKGPSLDPEEKRLAVHVEEHPIEYAEFEGLIPEGEYGAGAVIVWDRGAWIHHGDPEEGLKNGKLLFDLFGHKLRGRWTLFRTGGGEPNHWLLMKKPDGAASTEAVLPEGSILSGLTVEQLGAGFDPAAELRDEFADTAEGDPDVADVELMLANVAPEPFDREGWIFEIKYDGYRLLGQRAGELVRLRLRNGGDATERFPEIATVLGRLPFDRFVIDGEVVALDDVGLPSFSRLQRRAQSATSAAAAIENPVTLFAFDLLAVEGHDLRGLPLVERKALLRRLLPERGAIRYSEHVEEAGLATFESARDLGLEGVVAKRADAPYAGGRSDDWLKVRADRHGDFAIVGLRPEKSSGLGVGAAQLAWWDGESWRYAGSVGSGLGEQQRKRLLEVAGEPVDPPAGAPKEKGSRWFAPTLVAEVRFKEWTPAERLRQPALLRLREDKPPTDCVEGPRPAVADVAIPERVAPAPPPPRLSLTNLDKPFWPDDGLTKGDLIDYYRDVAEWMLLYLRDRPLVMTRYPDGIDGKSFFQKDAPGFVPDWIRIETMQSEGKRDLRYFICDELDTLLYLANLATIPIHVWASRVPTIDEPDWAIVDLDPKEAPFEDVIALARATHELCETIGLPSFVKTTGSSGLHVLIPLIGTGCDFEQARVLAELLARVIAAEHPEIATVERNPKHREGKVYLDYLQNGQGKLIVAPFCLRPLAGAPASAPLKWSEVKRGLTPRKFGLKNVARRYRRLGVDPMAALFDERPDLPAALARLAERQALLGG